MKKAIWILTLFVVVFASCTPALDDADARDIKTTEGIRYKVPKS